MNVHKFIQWSQGASARERAEGAAALARSYLYGDFGPQDRREAETILFSLLDDPSPLVRRALADSFASSLDAPPAVIHGLANDQADIASIVLSRSPLLTDAQLIDCAAIADTAAQTAIALRAELSPAVSAALAEIASREALIALAVNEGAQLPDFALRRMIERFGDDGEFREALLGRAWLPGAARASLATAAARQLAEFAVARNWMSRARSERVAQESRDRATMIIAAGCSDYSEETGALAAYLRNVGQLTPGLALRALLCGQSGLFEATLAELTGLSPRRVAGLASEPRASGFAALYAKAGLPAPLLPAFRAALAALADQPDVDEDEEEGALRLPVIQSTLACCLEIADPALDRLVALLRRFEADAGREAGRRALERMLATVRHAPALSAPVAAASAAPVAAASAAPAAAPQAASVVHDEPVGRVEILDQPPSETEIVIDLVALERELIAA